MRKALLLVVVAMCFASALCQSAGTHSPAAWSRFRGPNGSGVRETGPLPVSFSPRHNLIWKVDLPKGHSSPIVWKDRIYLTGFRENTLLTMAIDRRSGTVVWERAWEQGSLKQVDQRNNPASPSPAVNDTHVVVFFPDAGLRAYSHQGELLWEHPLGPFNNIYGMGASPILVDGKAVLVCDQNTGSYIIAVDLSSGKTVWKQLRPEAKSGHSTPIIWRNQAGEDEILVPGSFQLSSYSPLSGERLWWVGGLSFEMKSTPVIAGDVLFINGYGSPLNQPGNQLELPAFEDAMAWDKNSDGSLSEEEITEPRLKGWVGFMDLDGSGALNREEWAYLKAALATTNGMLAIRLGGREDMTAHNTIWQYHKSVPQLPSPLVYQGILYMVNDGGIVTSFDPDTGKVLAQGRLKEALDKYYASPVGSDGKVFMVSEQGKVAVVKPGEDLEVLEVNDLGESVYATPAISDGRIYIRTVESLYAFGLASTASPGN